MINQRGPLSSPADQKLLHWLLAHGADPNAHAGKTAITPLSEAVACGSLDLIKLLFEHGGCATEGDLIYNLYKRSHDRADILPKMRFLIERGAQVNEALYERLPHIADLGWFTTTPLIMACYAGDEEVVKLLLFTGHADPQKTSWYGHTPMKAAVERGHVEIQKLLTKAMGSQPKL